MSPRDAVNTSAPQRAAAPPLNIAPGSSVSVRDAEWLVTQVEATNLGLLVTAAGPSQLVRDVRATFYEHLDQIVPFDPRRATSVARNSMNACNSSGHSCTWLLRVSATNSSLLGSANRVR